MRLTANLRACNGKDTESPFWTNTNTEIIFYCKCVYNYYTISVWRVCADYLNLKFKVLKLDNDIFYLSWEVQSQVTFFMSFIPRLYKDLIFIIYDACHV
jgi:hypothetical protein